MLNSDAAKWKTKHFSIILLSCWCFYNCYRRTRGFNLSFLTFSLTVRILHSVCSSIINIKDSGAKKKKSNKKIESPCLIVMRRCPCDDKRFAIKHFCIVSVLQLFKVPSILQVIGSYPLNILICPHLILFNNFFRINLKWTTGPKGRLCQVVKIAATFVRRLM